MTMWKFIKWPRRKPADTTQSLRKQAVLLAAEVADLTSSLASMTADRNYWRDRYLDLSQRSDKTQRTDLDSVERMRQMRASLEASTKAAIDQAVAKITDRIGHTDAGMIGGFRKDREDLSYIRQYVGIIFDNQMKAARKKTTRKRKG